MIEKCEKKSNFKRERMDGRNGSQEAVGQR